MKLPITGLFAGAVQAMPGDGRPTAIFKQPVSASVRINVDGLENDVQADRRVHGGPEKAVHHFPLETHARLATAFPDAAHSLGAGGLGENLSTEGADESSVCIGDIYRLGTAHVQLCQPRTPCWKIDARHGVEGMTRYVADHAIAGWYYRVLAPGEVEVGDLWELLDRAPDPFTLTDFWRIAREHRPAIDSLQRLLAAPGLASGWQRMLADRIDWLRGN